MKLHQTKKQLRLPHGNPFVTLASLVFFFYCSLSFGQNTISVNYTQTPLQEVVKDIETQTGLLFSYADELIADKRITFKKDNLTIDTLLPELQRQTQLLFERIGENQIIISRPQNKTSICGYLFDAATKTALPYANVLIRGTTEGFTTDENGYFSIADTDLSNGILLQYVGFAERLLFPKDFETADCKNFFLFPEAESLQEVIVQSYLLEGIDKNKDGSIVLKAENQGLLPGLVQSDVFRSAQWVPGITSINETVSDVQIRGGSADQNLILFDGIKMYNTGHFFGMVSIFNPTITTNATIFKGGANAEYGGRIAGVIDIKGETQVPEKTHFGAGLNGTQIDGYVKAKLSNKVGLIVSGRRSYADIAGFDTPTYNALSEKVFQNTVIESGQDMIAEEGEDPETLVEGENRFFFYDTNVKLILKPTQNDSLYLSGLLTRNDLDFNLLDDGNRSVDKLISESEGLSFNWAGKKGTHWRHQLSGYYSNYKSTYTNQFLDEETLQENNLRSNSVKDYGFDAHITYDFNKKQGVKLGFQGSQNEVFYRLFRNEIDENGNTITDDEERDFNETSNIKNTTQALYSDYTYRLKNNGLISTGLRATRFSVLEDWYLEPRLNVEYPIGKIVRLKLTGEKRYQVLSQLIEFEDTRLRLESGIWSLTDDEDVPLLESTQFSGGVLLNFDGFTVDIDGYTKRIKGLTSFTNGFTNASGEYSQGNSDILGLDVLLKKQLGDYQFWLGYTYNNIDYAFDELSDTTFSGNNDITHNLTLSNTYKLDQWEFSLGWNFRTGAPFTPVFGFNEEEDIDFGPINSARLPNYHRLDASVRYQFTLGTQKSTKGILGLSFQNLYGRQVPLSVFYRVDENKDTGLDEVEQLEQLSLGFMPNFLVRIAF